MAKHEKFSVREIKAALESSGGNIVAAADQLGAHRATIYNYLERYVSLSDVAKKARRSKRSLRIEIAERNLDRDLEAGRRWATEFVLSTLGRDRGYVRGQILQGDPENPLPVASLTPDQWKEQKRRQAEAAGLTLEP